MAPERYSRERVLRICSAPFAACALLLLAGCEGKVTADLATDVPADRTLQQVNVNVAGLEFRKDDGSVESLTFRNSERVDLLTYLISFDDRPLRLFTNEELPEGNYTGVRLAFDTDPDEDPEVVEADGSRVPLLLAEGDYADFNFKVDDNESSSESVTLTLDLRQSLTFDEDNDEYTLQPYLRSVPSDDSGEINGSVSVTCPTGHSLTDGGAVYAFKGRDVEPDDRDGIGIEPFATAEAYSTQTSGQFFYVLRYLPEGDYTLAVTCRGDEESLLTDDDLAFRAVTNVSLDRGEVLRRDLGG